MNTKENESEKPASETENQVLQQDTPLTIKEEDAGEADLPQAAGPVVSELEKAVAESAEWKDKYLRLYAEFDNFRQRTSREKLALVGTATEGLMSELLPVVDDFERSLKAMETARDVESLREGVDLVYQKLMKVLARKGLKAMESIGQPFDAELHEAITQIPAPAEEQKGHVLDEIEKGYSLNEKTIRFAKVVIGA
jgi:molecular chaperone GrpE